MMIDTCYLDTFYQQQKNKIKNKANFSLPALPCSQLLLLHTNHRKADTHLGIDRRMQMEIKVFNCTSEYDNCLATVLRRKGKIQKKKVN